MTRRRLRGFKDRSFEELDEAGLCECGAWLDEHPPLPKPLPWQHGRPCARAAEGQYAAGSSFLSRRKRGPDLVQRTRVSRATNGLGHGVPDRAKEQAQFAARRRGRA